MIIEIWVKKIQKLLIQISFSQGPAKKQELMLNLDINRLENQVCLFGVMNQVSSFI